MSGDRGTIPQYVLRVRRLGQGETTLELGADPITLGRSSTNTIELEDNAVSRYHARIDPEDGGYVVSDRESKNGTLVNGVPVGRQVLREGDVIEVGSSEFWFCTAAAATPPPDPEPAPERGPLPDRFVISEPGGINALAEFSGMMSSVANELSSLNEIAGHLTTLIPCDRATVVLVGAGRPVEFSRPADPDVKSDGPDPAVVHAALTIERPMCIRVPRAPVIGATLGARHHLLLMPLSARDEKFGLLALERGVQMPPFEDADLLYISIAAHHVATFLQALR